MKKSLTILSVVVGLFFFASDVSANTISSQTDLSIHTSTLTGSSQLLQKLGTGLSGTVTAISVYVNRQSAYTTPILKIQCYTSNTYASLCNGDSSGGATASTTDPTGTSGALYSWPMYKMNSGGAGTGTFLTLDSSKYYAIQFQNTDNLQVYGSSSVTFPQITMPVGSGLGSLGNMYFVITGLDVSNASTTGNFIVSSPLDKSVTASTNVTFSYSYFNAGSYDKSGVQATDITTHTTLNISENSVISSGTGNYYNVVSLSANHLFQWRPYVRLSTTGEYVYGPYFRFSTISQQLPGIVGTDSSVDISTLSDENASSSVSTSLSTLVNWHATLVNRIPFGWIYDIYKIYNTAATTSISEFSALSYDFGDTRISTGTRSFLPSSIVVFSTTTVTTYLSPTVLDPFNALVSAILWVLLMMYIWRRTTSLIPSI